LPRLLLYQRDISARGVLIVPKMETIISSETYVSFFSITRRSVPEDSHIHGYDCLGGDLLIN
jgi:hypothetical protein